MSDTPLPPPLPSRPDPAPPRSAAAFDPSASLDDARAETLASHHVTEHTRTYRCGACGGELQFDIATQLLRCQHCGNTHELRENTGVVEEQNLARAIAFVRAGRSGAASESMAGDKDGQVDNAFDDVTVFANDGFERARVSQLEPWPTVDAKPYSPEYVAGHLCRTYDHDVDECFPEAKQAMEVTIRRSVEQAIGGNEQRVHAIRTQWRSTSYKHLLLPIWLLTVIYMDRPFQVYINGVTGEVHGARPYSKVKIITAVVVAVVVAIALIVLYATLRSGSG